MNPVILLPDGVGIRNFVLGPFLATLAQQSHGLLLHPIPTPNLAEYRHRCSGQFNWQQILPYQESSLTMTLRYSLAYAQMYWADTQSMRYGRRAQLRGSWSRRLMLQAARIIGRAFASPAGLKRLDRWHSREAARVTQVKCYKALFTRAQTTVLFCSHQRPLEILPAVLAAQSLGIPTATFIFSWDNLTSKGRIAAPFDHYLVWSELMKEELLKYYPDVDTHRVHVVGTPQFDPYADQALLWSREEFFKR